MKQNLLEILVNPTVTIKSYSKEVAPVESNCGFLRPFDALPQSPDFMSTTICQQPMVRSGRLCKISHDVEPILSRLMDGLVRLVRPGKRPA